MNHFQVLKNVAYCLAHVPELVCHGSKPRREISRDPGLENAIRAHLRGYAQAVCYPPNQTFLGNLRPEALANLPRPWFTKTCGKQETEQQRRGPFGEIVDQTLFYALLRRADILKPPLFALAGREEATLEKSLAGHPLFGGQPEPAANKEQADQQQGTQHAPALPLTLSGRTIGFFHGDERAEGMDDDNLAPHILLEALCGKASGALALRWLLQREDLAPSGIDCVISCGEEACGDRYQRGGGGMAKAMAEMCGCLNASGFDLKNFCAAPANALVVAAALVKAGVHARVAVVGGGSLAKLGMKFQAFLAHGMPILDDCLASMAFLVTADDGVNPVIRMAPGAVGKVPVGAGSSDEAVFRHYLLEPLAALGLGLTDIDRFAPELQNPEIMEFAGSGDVAAKNYRKIAAMAVMDGQLNKKEMTAWLTRVGMPGFAPTQGHIPSAVPYLGHAREAMLKGEMTRVMFLARASIFLNRCTSMLDGVSFLLERNPGGRG
ncbi:glycine/sarcosine/betaine reductase complex component C subunit beta [Thiovibrio sp. JS02]